MVSKIFSAALQGLSARIIEIETVVSKGLRAFNIVGLGDKAIIEAKERVNQAIKTIGFKPPYHQTKKVLVNLAPADFKKEGSLYDLPIALGYLLASGQAKFDSQSKIILGELALDGSLKPVKGSLCFSLLAMEKGFKEIILPIENIFEASLLNLNEEKIKVVGVKDLKQAIRYLEEKEQINSVKIESEIFKKEISNFEVEFGWIRGQVHVKRALEIAAAGGHNVLMEGTPGAGKTLLAKAIISILPQLSLEESLELTKIYSAAGLLNKERSFIFQRPFRAPHHTSSEVSLIGGGNPFHPGEISLSHRGILFLDEFPEFHRDLLESLRQPLEEGKITIQRAHYFYILPAKFTLIAAANPCPCGYLNNPTKECICSFSQINSYRRKLSGPLMDRIDIFCYVPSLKYKELISEDNFDLTKKIRFKIENSYKIQKERFKKEGILTNSEMNIVQIKKYCQIDNSAKEILKKYIDSGRLSARGYHRVLKTARTIADLEQRETISFDNLTEALMYRLRENINYPNL